MSYKTIDKIDMLVYIDNIVFENAIWVFSQVDVSNKKIGVWKHILNYVVFKRCDFN